MCIKTRSMDKVKPEILSPAGDMEKLFMAVNYGADAVYLSGETFGMRASSASFSRDKLSEAVEYAHSKGVKVYVTCNTLPREYEIPELPDYLGFLSEIKADALIIADLGVLAIANRYAPKIAKHVSTQLGVVNSAAADALQRLGADTVVLARELSIEEIRRLHANVSEELRLECFVHGAMCVSFSGRCLLSNYLTGRDANRGKCAQPCRWKYHVMEESRPGELFEITEDKGTYLYNSRDLCMIEHLDELMDAGIASFKIEGRMKSAYYTACVTNAYRAVTDAVFDSRLPAPGWIKEVEKVSHRPYSTGFFYGYPGQHYGDSSYIQDAEIVAISEGGGLFTQRNKFFRGDALELLEPGRLPVAFNAEGLEDQDGNDIDSTPRAMMKFRFKPRLEAEKYSIVRKPV